MEIILEFILFIVAGLVVFSGTLFFVVIISAREKETRESNTPKCTCKDAKQRFYEKPPND